MRRAALIGCALAAATPRPAIAAVERYAVIIGNNAGAADEQSLRYAEDDAEKLHEVLGNLGGFRPENLALLRGKDVATVRRSIIALNDRIRRTVASGRDQALLFVYYSGHADAESLHLGGSSFELGELEALVRGSPATIRLLVLDACRSGAVTRVKGGRPGPDFQILLDERLAGEGVVFLTSSSANEDAHESDSIRGSFFTHYFVSGLLGAADIDGDGKVVLDEAYRFAYENTLRASSRTLGGMQHPTYRYDLKGRGNLALTTLRSPRRATLSFPEGRTYLVMDGSPGGAVVAEVGVRDRSRTISVRPGRYFIRGRARSYLLEGTVAVSAGKVERVRDDSLARIAYARLARKGSGPVRVVRGMQVGYRLRTPLSSGASVCQGPFVGYAMETRVVNVVPRIGVCQEDQAIHPRGAGLVGAHVVVVGAVLGEGHARDARLDLVGKDAHIGRDRRDGNVDSGRELDDERSPEEVAVRLPTAAHGKVLERARAGVELVVLRHGVERAHAFERQHRGVEHGDVRELVIVLRGAVHSGLGVAVGGKPSATEDRLCVLLCRVALGLGKDLALVGECGRVLPCGRARTEDGLLVARAAGCARAVWRRFQVHVWRRPGDGLAVVGPGGDHDERSKGARGACQRNQSPPAGCRSHLVIIVVSRRDASIGRLRRGRRMDSRRRRPAAVHQRNQR